MAKYKNVNKEKISCCSFLFEPRKKKITYQSQSIKGKQSGEVKGQTFSI